MDDRFDYTEVSVDAKVLIISVAAQMAGMHPQTLRQYDRLGLVSPGRTAGRGRRYSARDIELLRQVQQLSQDEGINLAGIKRIIDLEQLVDQLQNQMAELQEIAEAALQRVAELEAMSPFPSRELLLSPRTSTALVVWKPKKKS